MRRLAAIVALVLLGVVLPLAGARLAGRPLEPYLQLAPQPPLPAASSFYWSAFFIYALLIVVVAAPFAHRIATTAAPRSSAVSVHPFPWWGWFGFALTIVTWIVAWTRLPWAASYQTYTFTPLWFGYILVVNGLVHRRTGRSLPRERPLCFAALFPASAAFWWYFEYLNRYVGNWYYVGIEPISPLEYFVHASVSFSTVLPAVVSTRDWLASFPRLQAAFAAWRPVSSAAALPVVWLLLALGAAGLVALGAWPHYGYAMAWLAPMCLLLALQRLATRAGVLDELQRGDWRGLTLPALAALLAGFFWELWNWRSLAHWEYSIPLVDRFLLFEMPLLGYAGYLPFGIACVVVAGLVCGRP